MYKQKKEEEKEKVPVDSWGDNHWILCQYSFNTLKCHHLRLGNWIHYIISCKFIQIYKKNNKKQQNKVF